jgi:hypothetical protein
LVFSLSVIVTADESTPDSINSLFLKYFSSNNVFGCLTFAAAVISVHDKYFTTTTAELEQSSTFVYIHTNEIQLQSSHNINSLKDKK